VKTNVKEKEKEGVMHFCIMTEETIPEKAIRLLTVMIMVV